MNKLATTDFEKMIGILRSQNKGKVIDSFIRVELGCDEFRASWDAFKDASQFFGDEYDDDGEMLHTYLTLLDDEIHFSEAGYSLCP